MLGTALPGPRPPWIRHLSSPPDQPGRKRRGLTTAGPPRKQSIICILSPHSALGAEEHFIGSPRAHFSARASIRCYSRQNKTHAFSKREQISSSAYHKRPALRQPVFRAVSTSCHAVRALAGYPRCVRVGNDYDKMRLYTPIRLKTTALPRCARHHSAQRGCSSPSRRGDESAGKSSNRNHSSSPKRVRLLQPLLYISGKSLAKLE